MPGGSRIVRCRGRPRGDILQDVLQGRRGVPAGRRSAGWAAPHRRGAGLRARARRLAGPGALGDGRGARRGVVVRPAKRAGDPARRRRGRRHRGRDRGRSRAGGDLRATSRGTASGTTRRRSTRWRPGGTRCATRCTPSAATPGTSGSCTTPRGRGTVALALYAATGQHRDSPRPRPRSRPPSRSSSSWRPRSTLACERRWASSWRCSSALNPVTTCGIVTHQVDGILVSLMACTVAAGIVLPAAPAWLPALVVFVSAPLHEHEVHRPGLPVLLLSWPAGCTACGGAAISSCATRPWRRRRWSSACGARLQPVRHEHGAPRAPVLPDAGIGRAPRPRRPGQGPDRALRDAAEHDGRAAASSGWPTGSSAGRARRPTSPRTRSSCGRSRRRGATSRSTTSTTCGSAASARSFSGRCCWRWRSAVVGCARRVAARRRCC